MCTLEGPQKWTRSRILFSSFAARITLILYSHIHDYIFKVSFTDIDYHVFTNASHFVWNRRSPFDEPTYRYTPALAWIILPVVHFPDFGKFLFCVFDIIVAWLLLLLLDDDEDVKKRCNETSEGIMDAQMRIVVWCWLANPLTAVISARGNAEALVCAAVLLTLYLLKMQHWKAAAIVHGSLAIHLKIYPLIFLPSVFLHLSDWELSKGFLQLPRLMIANRRGFAYVIIALLSFATLVLFFYAIYGEKFFEEFLFYHLKRRDIRHNFSPYFYLLYLSDGNELLSKVIGFGAFLPQMILTVLFAFRFFNDLPFCWFISTFSFVSYNKVCTSQYFVWYLVLLPLVVPRITLKQQKLQMESSRILKLALAWVSAQAVWLFFAYLFEFQGYQTFLHMFLASLFFLFVNSVILREIVTSHSTLSPKLKSKSQ